MIDYPYYIRQSGLTIYDYIDPRDDRLYIPTYALEVILRDSLVGLSLSGLALRTRSKVVKSAICEALGYPIPRSFAKTQPRFPPNYLYKGPEDRQRDRRRSSKRTSCTRQPRPPGAPEAGFAG